ncbi:nuclear condensing complex subunit [Lentinula edodes]|nr:nuclear condensing complex subunit [Lentinula edodes]
MAQRISQKSRNSSEVLNTLPRRVSEIMNEVQLSSSNHHKNKVALHRVYVDAISIREVVKDGCILTGMHRFKHAIYLMVIRLLDAEKGASGDRVAKFLVEFIKYLLEKDFHEYEQDLNKIQGSIAQTFTNQFVQQLLKKGCAAKEKNIRYRSVALCANIAVGLVQIHESLYYSLREILFDRINDKDWTIREHAAMALCTFHRVDDPEELEAKGLTSLSSDVLLDSLSNDTKQNVRLSILKNLDIREDTIDYILDRTRDTVVEVRKEVYSLLEKNVLIGDEDDKDDLEMGRTHPKILSNAHRDLIIKNGLGDRDPSVRDSAVKLLTKWVDSITIGDVLQDRPQGSMQETNLSKLLTLFNLRANDTLSEAIIKVFETNPRICNDVLFCKADWSAFTPETAFLERVYFQYCVKNKCIMQLAEVHPVVMDFAFYMQEYFNGMVDVIQRYQEEASNTNLDDVARAILQAQVDDQELITSEVLKIAIHLDYGDEIGRRKMEQLVRDFLIHEDLPVGLIGPCVELLKEITVNEHELIHIVNHIIIPTVLRNSEVDVDQFCANFDALDVTSFPSQRQQAREYSAGSQGQKEKVTARCLCICESMLVLVNVIFEELSPIRNIADLVYSAVERETDDEIKEMAFRCFALIGLIYPSVAAKALEFFLGHMANHNMPDELRLLATQVSFDLLLWYGEENMHKWCNVGVDHLVIHFVEALDEEEPTDDMRVLLCEGLVKLMNAGVLVDERITNLLIENYFSPEYTKNQSLKQCLSFFVQKYCALLPDNQERISKTFVHAFLKLYDKLDTDGLPLIAQFVDMFLTWTHPKYIQKCGVNLDTSIHLNLAFRIIRELLQEDSLRVPKHKKILLQVFSHKLYLPDHIDDVEVRHFKMLLDKIPSVSLFFHLDASSKKGFEKFQMDFAKKYEKQLELLTEINLRALDKFQKEIAFLDEIIPSRPESSSLNIGKSSKRGKKRSVSFTDFKITNSSQKYEY